MFEPSQLALILETLLQTWSTAEQVPGTPYRRTLSSGCLANAFNFLQAEGQAQQAQLLLSLMEVALAYASK